MDEKMDNESRMWATFCHLAALVAYLGIPLGNIIGPLVIWLIKKDELPFVDNQGKESLNFQISMTIYSIVALFLCFVIIGIPILAGLVIADLVLVIIAAVKANEGIAYEYPITIRFFK